MMLFAKELKKILLAHRGLLVLAVCLALKTVLLCVFPEQKDSRILLSQKQYDAYLSQLTGANTPEKTEFIRSEYTRCKEALDAYEDMYKSYESGDLSDEAWEAYTRERGYADLHITSAEIFLEKAEQFLIQPDSLPSAHYIYEYGWETVYTLLMFPDIFLLAGTLILTAQCFSEEASAGMLPVLLAARNGRRKWFHTKLFALLTICFGASLLGGGLELLIFYLRGFCADGNAPMYSVTVMGNCLLNISLWEGYFLCQGMRVFSLLFFAGMAFGISVWIKDAANLFFAGACILVLPLIWNRSTVLFTHGGLLSGSKMLLWLSSSEIALAIPVAAVAAYSTGIILLAARRHQCGL